MSRTLSEQQVLNWLDIPDFRHMSKDKIVKFASMLPRMNPEVAKAALAQIPEYVKLASEIVSTYKEVIDKMFAANATDTKAFYDACNGILVSLDRQLHEGDISKEERDSLNDRMITVAKMIGDKGLENKRYWMSVLGTFGKIALGVLAPLALIFGIKFFSNKDDDI